MGRVGGVLARWRPRAVGQRGQDDQAVGRRHGSADPHLRGALGCGHVGGVLARWRPRAVGQPGQDDQAVGRGHGGADPHLRGAFGFGQCRWRSRPMAAACCRAAGTRRIKLWDAATGALIRTFEGHSDGVTSVAFSPDGAPRAVGQLGQDGQAVGRRHGSADPHLRGALRSGHFGGVLARWRPRAVGQRRQARSSCGTPPPGR